MPIIVEQTPMTIGSHFRGVSLRGDERAWPIDPIMGVDHAWIKAATFPPHPHAGFSAVSYLFLDSETRIENYDSRGHHNVILPGGLHWTAAGRGVVHEEFPSEAGKTVHTLQIFVNLAETHQGDAPFALSLAPDGVPVVRTPGATVRVPLGRFGDARSPLSPPTDITLLDVGLDEGASLTIPVPTGEAAFVLPVGGVIGVNDARFDPGQLKVPVFPALETAQTLVLTAPAGHAAAAVFLGVPLRQPVLWQGSLAMTSAAALSASAAAYRRGDFGHLDSHAPK
jgi:hypothetical protein